MLAALCAKKKEGENIKKWGENEKDEQGIAARKKKGGEKDERLLLV
jgi:hypothetical protein